MGTLVLTVIGRETLWLVADRRLTLSNSVHRDDAVKVLSLDAEDGVGVIAYAGLGATAAGMEPSAWMSATLRGGIGLFENALARLAEAANYQLPRHLAALPGGRHVALAPVLYKGGGAQVFAIENIVDASTGLHQSRFLRINRGSSPGSPTIAITAVGTGGPTLDRMGTQWRRSLHSLVKANGEGKISDGTVADRLAHLSYQTHLRTADGSVGPRSVVVWRRRPESPLPGGSHAFYNGTQQESQTPAIPTLAGGFDVAALASAVMSVAQKDPFGQWADPDTLKKAVEGIPDKPDDRLT